MVYLFILEISNHTDLLHVSCHDNFSQVRAGWQVGRLSEFTVFVVIREERAGPLWKVEVETWLTPF